MTTTGKRIVYFDATDTSLASKFWWPGGKLYRAAGMVDEVKPVLTWPELFYHLSCQQEESVSRVEVWAHGSPGRVYINGRALKIGDDGGLAVAGVPSHELDLLLRSGTMTDDGVFWLRSCSSLAGPWGKIFAERLARKLECTAAGHTHHVAVWQAGFQATDVFGDALWEADEGGVNVKSWPWSRRCIPAWANKIPEEWLP